MSGRSKKRRSEPEKVGRMLETVLGDLGLETAVAAFRVGEIWEDAVGPQIAAHCSPVGIRGRVLEVNVDSSVWCQHLQLQKTDLLHALAAAMGDDAPIDMRFRVG